MPRRWQRSPTSWKPTLRHDLAIEGAGFRLRPVDLDDAAFILTLRTDPALSRHLHPVSGDIEDQHKWMQRYFDRADDFYFIVERADEAEPVGTIALVDVTGPGGSAEWGRWILRPRSMAAVASALLVYRLGFTALGLDRIYCNTVRDNTQVVSFHDSCGLERTATLTGHFDLGGTRRDAVQHTLHREAWPAVESALTRKADRLHQLLQRRKP